jgi:hypothetical protein
MSVACRRWLPFVTVILVGCTAGVREDRTIHFTTDGRQVAFQHGQDGVFIAESEGTELLKIFQPDADTIAVSAPLWSSTDTRLIFTTAKSAEKEEQKGQLLAREPRPEGELLFAGRTVYTCWLRGKAKEGQATNLPLFTVPCGHPGYVAANLAVRWHPDGQHLLFIQSEPSGGHGLYEYDLQTEKSRRVFPITTGDLIFDWTPDQKHVVCVVSRSSKGEKDAGIWIGNPDTDDWRQLHEFAEGEARNLEDLRAIRPVWTRDGSRFAFVVRRSNRNDKQSTNYSLYLGTVQPTAIAALKSGDKEIRDLHWRPDGRRLGWLKGGGVGSVYLLDIDNKREHAFDKEAFCAFLGWDSTGEQLAMTARQSLPSDPAQSWSFLFLPDVRSRSRVLVAPDAEPARAKIIFSGLQVTFAQWSAKETKLSMWATFRPAYRSWLSYFLDLGADNANPLRGLTLRAGDPALVIDPATGERNWKAIDSHEKMQIGHYHLLHGQYAEAWKWYEKSGEPLPKDERTPQQFIERFVRGNDSLFFQSICLDKLGRGDEARAKRKLFDQTFLPTLSAPPKESSTNGIIAFGSADIRPSQDQLQHWRDLYLAEVFLSLDALEDGERFFRDGLQAATKDADRLSKALVLTQFLLLRYKRQEYAELATDTVLPLLLRSWKPRAPLQSVRSTDNLLLAYSDGLSLLPLMSEKFLSVLSEKQVRSMESRWLKQRSAADDDIKQLCVDLFLEAAARRLGQNDKQQAIARRLAANSARKEILEDKGIADLIARVRQVPEMFAWIEENMLGR